MAANNLRDLLTCFSPSSDYFAVASADGRIKIWDTLKGHLQTEFADIASSADDDTPMVGGHGRGHLAVDYKCMKWVQLKSKKRKKVGSSLLVLGTGSGDVLALDVAFGKLKWRVCDCHPGGVTAVSFSKHKSCIYTAGVDGMVCQIDSSTGNVVEKVKSSRKAISALSISPDGELLATAASQMKIFNSSNHNKIKKFSGHPVAVRTMIFSEDGKYILSSAVGERYIAIWKNDGSKNKSASCVLSLEHPAIILDTKGTDTEGSEGTGLYVLAISEVGHCYYWHGSSIEALQNSKPTKIMPMDSSSSKSNKGLIAAKFDSLSQPASASVFVAYGTLIKPLFKKLVVQYGQDMNLQASQDGVLVSMDQSYVSHKNQKSVNKVTALDRANAEDATLPLPKLYASEKKRKHSKVSINTNIEKEVDPILGDVSKSSAGRAKGFPKQFEDGVTSMENKLISAGILSGKKTTKLASHLPIDANSPMKKVRNHIMSLSPSDACKLFETIVCSWKSRSIASKQALSWIYFILVIHGQFIISQESCKDLIVSLKEMANSRYQTVHALAKLSGRLHLIMTQIDKAVKNNVQIPLDEHNADQSEDEEDEDIDDLVYGEDQDASESDGDDVN